MLKFCWWVWERNLMTWNWIVKIICLNCRTLEVKILRMLLQQQQPSPSSYHHPPWHQTQISFVRRKPFVRQKSYTSTLLMSHWGKFTTGNNTLLHWITCMSFSVIEPCLITDQWIRTSWSCAKATRFMFWSSATTAGLLVLIRGTDISELFRATTWNVFTIKCRYKII